MFRERAPGVKLNIQEKGALIGLFNARVPLPDIAQQMGCHINTVKKWIRRYQDTNDVKRKIGSGGPRKTTRVQDNMLLQAVRAKPLTTLQELKGINDFILFLSSFFFLICYIV